MKFDPKTAFQQMPDMQVERLELVAHQWVMMRMREKAGLIPFKMDLRSDYKTIYGEMIDELVVYFLTREHVEDVPYSHPKNWWHALLAACRLPHKRTELILKRQVTYCCPHLDTGNRTHIDWMATRSMEFPKDLEPPVEK